MPLAAHQRARAAMMQLGAQVLNTLAGYVTAVVLARELGPAVFGVYAIVYSILLTTEVVGRLGVPNALTKLVAQQDDGRTEVEATGMVTGAAIYALLFVLFMLASPWLATLLGLPGQGWYFRLAAADIPFYGMYFVINAILNGRQDFHLSALATAIYATCKIGAVLGLLLIGVSVEGAFIANAIASLIGLSVAVAAARNLHFGIYRPAFSALTRLAAPLSLRGVASQLMMGMGLWSLGIAGAAISGEAKGLYAAANSVARLPVIMSIGVSGIVVASIAAALGRGDRDAAIAVLAGVGRAMLIVLVPATGLLMVEAGAVMRLLFAERYADGGPLLAVLVLGQGFSFTFMMILTGALIAASRPGLALLCGFFGVAISAIGISALLPFFGTMGTAIGASTGSLLSAVAAGLLAWRFIGPWFKLGELVRISLATLPVLAASFLFETRDLMLLVELTVLGLAQLALLALFRVLSMSDVNLIIGRANPVASSATTR
ncbi:MAG: oligosaccharide flippase family protein [Pseudomonadota bacterium]